NYQLYGESGHDRFFDTFDRFGFAGNGRDADMLAEARQTAARDRLQYVELMRTLDGGRVIPLAFSLGWKDDFAAMRKSLLDAGLRDSLRLALGELTRIEGNADSI